MQAGGHLSSGVSAARSAAKGRGLEGSADGDEGVGDEGAASQSLVAGDPSFASSPITISSIRTVCGFASSSPCIMVIRARRRGSNCVGRVSLTDPTNESNGNFTLVHV